MYSTVYILKLVWERRFWIHYIPHSVFKTLFLWINQHYEKEIFPRILHFFSIKKPRIRWTVVLHYITLHYAYRYSTCSIAFCNTDHILWIWFCIAAQATQIIKLSRKLFGRVPGVRIPGCQAACSLAVRYALKVCTTI